MKSEFSTPYLLSKEAIVNMIENFNKEGEQLVKGKRNSIRIFQMNDRILNIKSFKIPNPLNAVVYKFFRKSKAQRSFEYAGKLISMGIGTPAPAAFFENTSFGLKDSYYVSEHMQADLTFKDLVQNPDFPDHENILRQFTRFSFDLHEKGIEFLDHSPGNTLIVKDGVGKYSFYLVDLNRMKFHKQIPLDKRMKNLSRLTPKREMVMIMGNEYAKLCGETEEVVFRMLWEFTTDFQRRFRQKRRIKNTFKAKK